VIRVLLVADSGPVMASVTASLWQIAAVDIAGHASGRSRVAALVRSIQPDVVVVDQMCWTGLALTRIAEVRDADPRVPVVGLMAHADADWAPDGLRAGAAAVVPRDLHPHTLELVLREAIGTTADHQLAQSTERSAA
jgi:DNA-binding NarL/FixJ family response regulator